ncbi:MAG: amidohydrolase family protein [Cyclobacteriaceae bacterium]|nr:amidohydrolase family protein [Cyclobacteriaceae bacterium]
MSTLTALHAQNPAPAKEMAGPTAVMNATIHTATGRVINNGVLLFKDGKIEMVEDATNIRMDLTGYEIIAAEGMHVYPGLILPASRMGLSEIDAVRATLDYREVGDFNPHVRSAIAFNTDSEIIPVTRSNGILLTQPMPEGGIISGSSSVMHLDGWNYEDALVKEDVGIHLHWPKLFRNTGWWAEPGPTKKEESYEDDVKKINDFFAEAQAYDRKLSGNNQKMSAMQAVLKGDKKLFIHANYGKEIRDALDFASKYDQIEVVLVGADEAWMVIEEIKKAGVGVILSELHRLPNRPEDDYDLPFKQPALLADAGIRVSVSYEGNRSSRNLPFLAGHAVAYGMNQADALKMITLWPAEMLGISNQYGSLEEDKSATFIISAGDVLDMRTSKIERAFIDGREVNLVDKQKRLYEKFKYKYE